MDILKLVDEGERLGLRGQELRDFVGAQQERERASRALAREIAKENAVRERSMAKESYDRERDNSDRERENVDRERLIAREKFDRENDERERERSKQKAEFEIEMQLLEKQIALERMKANNNNINASYETLGANQKSRMTRPIIELPCFDEENDKIDSYLRHFERVASYEGWDIASYPIYLSTLLTGKARDVYCRLPLALANDYRYLKKALLAKYQLTVDDYSRKFFSVRQANEESCTDLWGDLEFNLDQWLELSNVEKTFEGLRELLLREQFLYSCKTDMAIFVKERAPMDQKSMLDMAINYESAHKYVGYEEAQRQPVSNQGGMRKCSNIPRYRHPQSNRHYRCKKVGHRANECRQTNNTPSQRDYHLKNSHGIANAGVTSLTHGCSIYESEAQLRCGCSVPVLGNAYVDYQPDIPTPMGYVSTEVERVLRGTGCSDEVNQGVELKCRDAISTQIEEGQKSTTDEYEEVQKSTTDAYEEVQKSTTDAHEEVQQSTTDAYEEVQQSTTDACEEVQQSTTDAFKEVQQSTTDAFEEVQQSTTDAFEEVQTSTTDAYEEVQQSTTDAYEEETYVYNYTYDDIDSDQFESDDEVSPDNVDREESDTMVETCVSEKQSRNSVTFKPLPVHKHCYVNISHRYLCSPFKEGGLRVMRQLWEKERIT